MLQAAFFAAVHGLRGELGSYFADPGGAEALRTALQQVPQTLQLGVGEVRVGAGRLVTGQASEPPFQVTDQPVVAGRPFDFSLRLEGCCDSYLEVWGSVRFQPGSGQRWQIAGLTLSAYYPRGDQVRPWPQA